MKFSLFFQKIPEQEGCKRNREKRQKKPKDGPSPSPVFDRRGIGGDPAALLSGLGPEKLGRLPALSGGAFGISRLRYSIAGVRLRPLNLRPRDFLAELAPAKKAEPAIQKPPEPHKGRQGRAVSIDLRGVDEVGFRKTSKFPYVKVQAMENSRKRPGSRAPVPFGATAQSGP